MSFEDQICLNLMHPASKMESNQGQFQWTQKSRSSNPTTREEAHISNWYNATRSGTKSTSCLHLSIFILAKNLGSKHLSATSFVSPWDLLKTYQPLPCFVEVMRPALAVLLAGFALVSGLRQDQTQSDLHEHYALEAGRPGHCDHKYADDNAWAESIEEDVRDCRKRTLFTYCTGKCQWKKETVADGYCDHKLADDNAWAESIEEDVRDCRKRTIFTYCTGKCQWKKETVPDGHCDHKLADDNAWAESIEEDVRDCRKRTIFTYCTGKCQWKKETVPDGHCDHKLADDNAWAESIEEDVRDCRKRTIFTYCTGKCQWKKETVADGYCDHKYADDNAWAESIEEDVRDCRKRTLFTYCTGKCQWINV